VLEKKVALTNKVVPELVGGARVVAGNRMIDWSVQGRMDALRRRMLDARLPS
jgi:F0F1-type ATP synthase delta subunit